MGRPVGWAAVVAVLAGLGAADGGRRLTVVGSRAVPPVEAVTVYPAGAVKPGKERPKPLATVTDLGTPVALPGDGAVDVYVRPKGGLDVLAAAGLAVRPGDARELKLADVLGTVEVFGDDLPRAEQIVLTAPDDPGPGEKGHTPVQVAAEYRVEMLAPEGVYAVWVKPASGARALKVADRVRVHAGRGVRVGG